MPIAVRPYAVALALLGAVTLGGCSDDGPSTLSQESEEFGPAPQPSADPRFDMESVRQDLVSLWTSDDRTEVNLSAGRCFAGLLVSNSDADELREAGILDEDYTLDPGLTGLTPEGAALWVDAQFACSDLVSESGRAQVAATKGKVDRAAYETCLRAAVTEEQLREVAESSLLGDLSGDAVATFSAAQLDCVQQALPPD